MKKLLLPILCFFALTTFAQAATIGKVNVNNLGLVLQLSFDGSVTNWTTRTTGDVSGTGNTGTILALGPATSTVAGKIGQAFTFSGNANSPGVTVANSSSIAITGDITLSTWIKTSSTTPSQELIMARWGVANSYALALNSSCDAGVTPCFSMFFGGGGGTLATPTVPALRDGKWHLVTATLKGSLASVYVDGIFLRSGGGRSVADGGQTLNIGYQSSSFGGAPYEGALDDMRIYNRALSATEVAALYNSGSAKVGRTTVNASTTPFSNGLVGYWTLDGSQTNWTTGSTTDSSGQGNNGTLISMSTTTSPTLGKFAQALNFNGAYVKVKTGTIAATLGSSTVSIWFRTTNSLSGCNGYSMYSERASSGNDIFKLDFNRCGSKTPSITWRNDAGNLLQFEAVTSATTDGKWHQFAVVMASSSVYLYVDGKPAGTTNTSINRSFTDAGIESRIGADAGDSQAIFIGALDDLHIFNRALSTSEISALYNSGSAKIGRSGAASGTTTAPLSNGLIGYWTFDGSKTNWATGKTFDSAGTSTGQLTSMSTTTTPAIGKVGQAMNFNGTSSYVDMGLVSTHYFNGTQPFTIAAWFYPTDMSTTTAIVARYNGLVVGNWFLGTAGGKLSGLREVTPFNINGITQIATSTWNHGVFVYDGASMRLYLNGNPDATPLASGNISTDESNLTTMIGAFQRTSSPNSFFKGKIDDVRVYNRALSANEVKQLYNMSK